MRRLLLMLGLVLFGLSAIHAQRTVTGKVTDSQGEPLIAVAVQIKGTTTGVISDFDGNYSIEVPSGNNILLFTYIGYKDQEVELGASNIVDVTMESESEILDEVVIVGYSQQDPERLVGSVGKIESEDIEGVPIGSVDQILQGRTSGLTVLGGSGQPGATAGYNILRGPGSINGGSQVMYIMDGIQITSSAYNALNPGDIENVTVLKDAAATSIYGSRGANGVIVITTKRGTSEKVKYTFRGQYGVADWTTGEFDMMNSTQKLAFEEAAMRGPGWTLSRNNPANDGAPEDVLESYDRQLDSLRGINTNWRDVLFQNGKTQSYELSASGGSQNTTYYVSGNYFNQQGQFEKSSFERGGIQFNIQHRASDNVKFGLNTNLTASRTDFISSENGINLNNPFAFAYLANPYEQVYHPDGSFQFGAVGRNPFEEVFYNDRFNKKLNAIGIAFLEIKFLKDFTFNTQGAINYRTTNSDTYISPNSRLGTTVTGASGSLNRGLGNRSEGTFTNTLNWTKRFGDNHRVEVLAGSEFIATRNESFSYTGYGVDPEIKTPAGITAGTGTNGFIPTVGGSKSQKNLMGLFARADYSFKDKYNIAAGIRRDGSSVFGQNNKWGTFYNFGASWIASREDFLQNSNFLNFLKFYLNYGTVGNDSGIGLYTYLGAYTNTIYNGDRGIFPNPGNPPNPDLKWEVSEQFNVGFEFGMWNNRLSGEVSLYRNNTSDLFITQQLSRTTGATSLSINSGEMRNQGVEIELNGDIIRTKDFYWNLGVNFSYNDNEITSLGQVDEQEAGTGIIKEGRPLGTHFVVGWAGVDPASGDPLYLDIDQNVTFNFSDANNLDIYGTYFPPYSGGINTEVGWKGLRLSALGIWVAERTLFNNQTFFQENPNFAQFNQFASMDVQENSASRGIWLNPGDNAQHQRIGTARQFSSKDLEDGSFFRLRNVKLSYDLPKSLLGNAVSGLQLYVQGQNLLTFTKFSGFDPEISNNIAQYEYPAQKTWTVGLQLDF